MAKNREINEEVKAEGSTPIVGRIFSYIFLVFVTVMCLFAFYMLIINATRSNAQLQSGFEAFPRENFFKNFMTAWKDESIPSIPRALFNSFTVAALSSILCTYCSALTAYGIHVYDFKLKKPAFTFIMVIMTIPTQVSAVGFIQLLYKIDLMDNYAPLIIPAIAAPSVFFYMKQYIESVLPLEVIEAARVDGSNEFRTFNTIALPMLRPAMAVQLIFAFVSSWNNLFTPSLILNTQDKYTVPVVLSLLRSKMNSQMGDLGEIYMIILLSIIPVVIVYFFVSKNIIQGVTLGSVKG